MKKHDKGNVIRIGQELFRTQGYYNTGTEEILNKSNYPRSSFYYNFKSKEGFAVQILEQYGNDASQFYKSILMNAELGKPIERLILFATKMSNTALAKKFKSECLIQKFAIECAAINATLREASEIQLNKIITIVKDCILQGQIKNEIRDDIDSLELAELYHAQLYGGFILARLSDNGEIMARNMDMVIDYLKK